MMPEKSSCGVTGAGVACAKARAGVRASMQPSAIDRTNGEVMEVGLSDWGILRDSSRSLRMTVGSGLLRGHQLHAAEPLVQNGYDVLRQRRIVQARRGGLPLVNRPLQKIHQLLALHRVG